MCGFIGGYTTRFGKSWEPVLFWGGILCIALILAPLRVNDLTADVSWLITVCEKILDGERLYIDVLETNPPFAVILYMPGVLFARVTGLTPEWATYALACVYVLISLALAARILPQYVADGGQSRWLVLLPAALLLMFLPNDAFAQREYFAAAFAVPMVAVFVRHGYDGRWPSLLDRSLAAILAGCTIAIKPPLFALPGILVAVYYWWQTKSSNFLFSSGLVAAGLLGLVFTIATLAIFPHYLGEIGLLMREAYIPVRSNPLSFLDDKACLAALSLLGLSLLLIDKRKPLPAVSLTIVVAAGFLATYFLQGKYFPYHAVPATLFGLIAAVISVHHRIQTIRLRSTTAWIPSACIYALAFGGVVTLLFSAFGNGRPTMSDLSWADQLSRPTTLAVSPDIATSFPLARRIGAIWVDRNHSQWVARYTRLALQSHGLTDGEKAKYTRHYVADLKWILQRIVQAKPDVIIQDVAPGYLWLSSELASIEPGFLDAYEPVAEEVGIRILRRRR